MRSDAGILVVLAKFVLFKPYAMEEYTVTDGLEEGMEVITTGNVNLAHEAPVKVIKN